MIKARVKETSTTTGTGTLSLAGAVAGFRTFINAFGNGNPCYYVIIDGTAWEFGMGVVTSGSPDTLTRVTVLDSSAAGAKLTLGAGTKSVFNDAPSFSYLMGTPVAATSGTQINFFNIPVGVRRITGMLSGVSTNGTDSLIVQIGGSGGAESTGYLGGLSLLSSVVTTARLTTGFYLTSTGASAAFAANGKFTLDLLDAATNTWVYASSVALSNADYTNVGAGSKAIASVLDRVSITTVLGTNTFDAGLINISYE